MTLFTSDESFPEAIQERFAKKRELGMKVIDFFRGQFHELAAFRDVSHIYRTEYRSVYKDDGNTQTPGTEYRYLISLPIMRIAIDDHSEFRNFWNNYGSAAIWISDEITARDSDKKFYYDVNLYPVKVNPHHMDTDKKPVSERFANLENFLSPHNALGVARMYACIKSTIENIKLHDKMLAVLKNLEARSS